MFNWWGKQKKQPQFLDEKATVRIIGDRGSGKTAYLASLAYWPNANSESPVQDVTAIGEAGDSLISQARDILEQGLELEPTDLNASAAEVKDYALKITLKSQFSWKHPTATGSGKLVQLTLQCKDYAGEFFSDLIHKSGDPKLEDYLNDCVNASGIVFLVDGTSHRKDASYAAGLDKFLNTLDRVDSRSLQRRLAFVATKCEQSELWVNRHQPKTLAELRFPKVSQRLETWQQMGTARVDYFATSAFGMLGTEFPQPNSKRLTRGRAGTSSVIKEPKLWRPFGLVAPIYWLCTGIRHKELDKD